jgi:hypothetical protein
VNWEIVGSTGEWAGAIAVVVTLFYLARQVKDATAVARSAARQAISQMNIDAWSVSIDTATLSRASSKAIAGETLKAEEQENYDRWILMRMRFIENAFYQYQQGLLDSVRTAHGQLHPLTGRSSRRRIPDELIPVSSPCPDT